jgi:uncharacterized protein
VEIKAGLEFWFTPSSEQQPRAPAQKQFLVTLSVIYPLTFLISFSLRPLFARSRFVNVVYVRQPLVGVAIVALITYVIMTLYTRAITKWLYCRGLRGPNDKTGALSKLLQIAKEMQ